MVDSAVQAALAMLRPGEGVRGEARNNAIIAFSVRVASAGLLYLMQIALARWMDDFEYGIFVLTWTWILVLGGLSHLGLGLAMIRLLPEYRETGQLELARGLSRGGRVLAVLVSSAVAALGLCGLLWLGARVESHFVWPAYLALVCLPMVALSEVQDGIGRSHGWMWVALLPNYVLRPFLILLAMIVAHGIGLPMVAATAVGAAIAATWIAAILQLVLLSRRVPSVIATGARRYDLRGWLGTSLPLLTVAAAELAMQNSDVLALSHFASPADVAIYFAAAKSMSLALFVQYAVGSAVANGLSALKARGDREGLAAHVRDAVRWTFWPSLAIASSILILGRPLLSLFGPNFVAGFPVMAILAVGILCKASMGPAEFMLNMMGQHKRCAGAVITAAACNIALQLVLVPRYGAHGAATATASAMFVSAMLQWTIARRRLGIDISIWANSRPVAG
jgi:O-antigen/teichoic acid export membrane protein